MIHPDAPGPSYGGVWGLNSLGFEGHNKLFTVHPTPVGPDSRTLSQKKKTNPHDATFRDKHLGSSVQSGTFTKYN